MPALTMIVAMARNNVIGYKGEMPWGHLPRDLKHFRELTMGHSVVVGYKTLLSIARTVGRNTDLLPGRKICVLTHNPRKIALSFPGCMAVLDIGSVIKLGLKNDIDIVGGEEIYQQFAHLPQTLTAHITQIHADYEGDTFFPDLDRNGWIMSGAPTFDPADAKNKHATSFYTMIRGASLK